MDVDRAPHRWCLRISVFILKNVDTIQWCGTPSAANPCLVRIMPGIYNLGNIGLAMQSYVDIEGSGENTTTISSSNSSGAEGEASATVTGADDAEIRFLTVKNQGGNMRSIAFYSGDNESPDITNVTATASGGTAITNWGSAPDPWLPFRRRNF